MDIIQTLDDIVATQLQEQQLRVRSILAKQKEIDRYGKVIKKEQNKIEEIEKEMKEVHLQIVKILKIKKQLKHSICVEV